jgi:uncharacterized protein YdcH (DUF465 family)
MPRPHIEIESIQLGGRGWVSKIAYDELLGEFQALNRDVTELRKNSGSMLDSEVEEIARIRQEHLRMKDELDQIALFVREHYAKEISMGQHKNMPTIGDVVIYYLGRERMAK